jgi:hypothetical protein
MGYFTGTVTNDFRNSLPHFICIGADDLVNPWARVLQLNFSLFVIRHCIPSFPLSYWIIKISLNFNQGFSVITKPPLNRAKHYIATIKIDKFR